MAQDSVTITIDYADKKPLQSIEVEYKEGMTALELLQKAAKVSIKKVDKYLFVTSINGVKSHSKTMAWFYKIDGVSAEKTASDNVLGDIKTMEWEFKIADCEI